MSLERFRQSFTGVALLLEPGETFETGKKPRPRSAARYAVQVLRQSHVLQRIIVVSLILQLFALAVPALTGLIIDRVVPRGDKELLLVVELLLVQAEELPPRGLRLVRLVLPRVRH